MSSWFGGFSPQKIKPYLKMSMQRITIKTNQKAVSTKKAKKEVAALLKDGKEEKARIRTEHIVREDFTVEAYDIISLLCELVLERMMLLSSEKECPFDMREAVCTLIYAANRTEIPELLKVKEQLTKKYGKEFAAQAMANHDDCVNERVIHKLSCEPPNAFLVMQYMKEIAKSYAVDWAPNEQTATSGMRFDAPMVAPSGLTVSSGSSSGITKPYDLTDGRLQPNLGGFGAAIPTATAVLPPRNAPAQLAKPDLGSVSASGGTSSSNGGGAGMGMSASAYAGLPPAASPSGKDLYRQGISSGSASGAGGALDGAGATHAAGASGLGGQPYAAPPALPPAAPSHAPAPAPPPTVQDTGERDTGATPDFDELSRRFEALKKRS